MVPDHEQPHGEGEPLGCRDPNNTYVTSYCPVSILMARGCDNCLSNETHMDCEI